MPPLLRALIAKPCSPDIAVRDTSEIPLRPTHSAWRRAHFAGLLLALSIGSAGCASAAQAPTGESEPLTVFAAASLADVFAQVDAGFVESHPGPSTVFNFAASDQLAQQILAGAPADVFASANAAQMQIVVEAGVVDEADARVFAHNRLVIAVPPDNPAVINSLADLANPGVRLVLGAAEVPAGRYALEILDRASADPTYGAGFPESVLANVRSYEENVRAVLAKVVLAEADAGIVYLTDARSSGDEVVAIEIPPDFNVVAEYFIAPLSAAVYPDRARAFLDYLLSAEGRSILAGAGFEPVGP
jgi:molybdate transport system substrate-binding protein